MKRQCGDCCDDDFSGTPLTQESTAVRGVCCRKLCLNLRCLHTVCLLTVFSVSLPCNTMRPSTLENLAVFWTLSLASTAFVVLRSDNF